MRRGGRESRRKGGREEMEEEGEEMKVGGECASEENKGKVSATDYFVQLIHVHTLVGVHTGTHSS